MLFYFQPADLVTQVLNFGVPTQIDVQVQGRDRANNNAIARELRQRMAGIPGFVDAHVQQELDAPELYYTVDRTRAQQLGLNMHDVANDLNISLSSSEQVSPNFWTDPKNGIPYFFAVQTPEYRISQQQPARQYADHAQHLTRPHPSPTCSATWRRRSGGAVQSVYNQSNIQAVYDVYAQRAGPRSRQRRGRHLQKIVDDMRGAAEAGQSHRHPRPDREHERGLRQSRRSA